MSRSGDLRVKSMADFSELGPLAFQRRRLFAVMVRSAHAAVQCASRSRGSCVCVGCGDLGVGARGSGSMYAAQAPAMSVKWVWRRQGDGPAKEVLRQVSGIWRPYG